ncbi:MAG: signal transduction histidine kinase [Glaciecola sp.]|jgi:signal transduction histidine kinase
MAEISSGVLLVEDNDLDAHLVIDLLTHGVEGNPTVDRVATLGEALRWIEKVTPTLIILDLHLPDLMTDVAQFPPGTDPVSVISQSLPEVPLVVLSGADDATSIRDAIDNGAHDYLVKGILLSRDQIHHTMRIAHERARRAVADRRIREEVDSFAHTIAHDIRNRLSMVSSAPMIISKLIEKGDAVNARDLAQRLGSTIKMLTSYVNGLLEYSFAGDALELSRVDLDVVVDWASALLDADLQEVGGEVHVAPLPGVLGDEAALRSIFLNLIGNAIRHRHDGRPLRVSITATSAPDGRIEISVADNGKGIAPHERESVFGRGVKGANSLDAGGSGIGLATVARMVHSMGGLAIATAGIGGMGTAIEFTVARAAPEGKQP